MDTEKTMNQLMEIASRIKEMREIMGFSIEEMSKKTNVSVETYKKYENGGEDHAYVHQHPIGSNAVFSGIFHQLNIVKHSDNVHRYITHKFR